MSSAQYYRTHKKARDKKQAYDSEYQKKPSAVKKRVEANKANRRSKTSKKGDGKDYDHATNRFVSESTNRGRAGEGGRKKGSQRSL
jgi:hypothetical protein